jgi:hypothetical protein
LACFAAFGLHSVHIAKSGLKVVHAVLRAWADTKGIFKGIAAQNGTCLQSYHACSKPGETKVHTWLHKSPTEVGL